MYSHVACDVMIERTLYLLKPSSLIWHLMPYLFLFTFNLDLGVKVIRNLVKYPLRHVTKSEVATSNGLEGENTLSDFGVKVTQKVAHVPLHHVICASTKLKFVTFNGLGGDAFARNVMDARTDLRAKLIT